MDRPAEIPEYKLFHWNMSSTKQPLTVHGGWVVNWRLSA